MRGMSEAVNMDAVRALSVEERLTLVAAILDTLDSDTIPFTPEQWAEIQQRLDDYRANPDSGVSYEDYKARIRSLS
jgi:putative addiction module component (TIGR02574 family)